MTWLSMPMTPTAVPSANMAEMIGRRAAKTEPKTSNRTIRASSTPSPVLLNDGLLAFSASCPVTETVSPSPDVLITVSTKFLASVCPMLFDCLSKGTWKNPTVRLALMSVVLTRLPAAS